MRFLLSSVLKSTVIVAAISIAAVQPARTQESFGATHFATLDASQETEPIADSIANGLAIFKIIPGTNTLEYRVTVTGLTDPIVGAHIHRGAPGANGPVVVPLDIANDRLTATGTVTDLRTSFIDSLLAGMAYVNVHTSVHTGGHIRGQILPIPNALALQMTAADEPHEVSSDSGTGTALLYINPATGLARYTIEWSSLTGRPTAAHFHLSAPGAPSGPPVHTIALPDDSTITRSSGEWTITPEQMAAMLEGRIYANVHTAINEAGEIRGTVFVADFFSAFVSPANEVPSRADSSSALGTATALALRMPGFGFLALSSIVNNTTGPITMAHIHRGAVGVNGNPFVSLMESTTPQNWDAFGVPVADSNMRRLWASQAYVNYHTDRFPGGEARGQLVPGLYNLTASPQSVPMTRNEMKELAVWLDRANSVITFALPRDVQADDGAMLELFTANGERVSRAPVSSSTVRIATDGLAAGAYFARLVVDGRSIASARVALR